jgi:amidase
MFFRRSAEGSMRAFLIATAALGVLAACQPAKTPEAIATPGDYSKLVIEPKTIAQLIDEMIGGATAESITRSYLDRIAAVDDAGPQLNAVLVINPNALANSQALDGLTAGDVKPGLLHGIPILLKDNIETLDPMPTTAGSLALQDNVTNRDSPLAARLRAAGAIILGKTNLSEWANVRSNGSSSGWSAVGGQTKNPHVLDRNPCGSSSGSGAAVAAGLAPAAIGTETDGSIVCPAGANGVVGIKPTVGLIPRTHIVPISASQDTAGPMALTIADAALLLTVMAGSDPSDPATKDADAHKADYVKALDANALAGKRIGVARFLAGYHGPTDAAFEAALEEMTAAGAILVDIKTPPDRRAMGEAEYAVLLAEFKAGLDAYLAATPAAVKTRSLSDLIKFNSDTPAELEFFNQDIFEEAAKAPALTDKVYLDALAKSKRLAGAEGIDRMLAADKLDAIVAPTGGPAWTTDLVTGDHFLGSSSALAAIAGYPAITVPMGQVRDLPVGISFFGAAWSEEKLIGIAYAFEQRTQARQEPHFRSASP